MMKRVFIVLLYLLSAHAFAACPLALPTNDANFCPSFKTAAICHCKAAGVPGVFCQNMNTLYSRMITLFGTLQRACNYQKYTPAQICIDNWNCYLNGGLDSYGRPCSGTKLACQ